MIPSDPQALARRLADIPAAATGLSPGRWANVRSMVNAAIGLVRPVMPGRHNAPLSPAWQIIYDRVGATPSRWKLSKVAHWLSAREIDPDAVTQDHLEEFLQALRQTTLSKNPEAIWRGTAWAWNAAVREVPGWPQVLVAIPSRKQTYTLPWTDFPDTFRTDVEGYLTRLSCDDLLDDGPAKPAKPSTLETRRLQLRCFASALVRRGRAPSSIRSLADLVEIDAYKEGLRFFIEMNDNKSSGYVHAFAILLKAVATHWVKVDSAHLKAMADIVKRVAPKRTGMTRKNRDRLRQLDDRDAAMALANLPQRLMREADKLGPQSRKAALLAMYAVTIEIWLVAPVRISNLLAIEVGVHLIRHRRSGGMHLVLEPDTEKIKNDQPLDYPLPEESVALIDKYLRIYHQRLTKVPNNTALFPGETVQFRDRSSFGKQVAAIVLKYTGIKVNPHLFRSIAGKTYLEVRPGDYGTVQHALGHRSIVTTQRFYCGTEIGAAVRKFDEVVLALRQAKPTPTPRGRRRK